MNNIKRILLSICLILPDLVRAELFLVDQGTCVVCGPEKNTIIADTDLTWKRSLADGAFVPLSKQIQLETVVQQVNAEKMPFDVSAVEKYIEGLKKSLKVNDVGFAELFADVGKTLPEGLKSLHDQYVSEFFTHYKFKSQLVPTDDEIMNYFNNNPVFVDGWYEVRVAKITFEDSEKNKVKELVDDIVAGKESDDGEVVWSAPLRIATEDLALDKQFVHEMKKDEIHAEEADNFFELIKLVDSEPTRIKSLDERKVSIIEALNRQKLEEMLKTYNQSIRSFIDIIPLSKGLNLSDE